MIEIDGDKKVLAKVTVSGKVYELLEVDYETILELSGAENSSLALLDVIESAGIPKEVSKKFSPRVIKGIEDALVSGLTAEKK